MSLIKIAAFDVILGEPGRKNSWQQEFPKETKCAYCDKKARFGFSVFERWKNKTYDPKEKFLCNLHQNEKGNYWPHDVVAIGVYFCPKCYKTTSLDNQA